MQLKRSTADRLGLFYLIAVTAVMVIISSYRPHRHYTIFTSAAQDMIHLNNPYGKAYDNLGVMSYWLYSPAAALLYVPFSYCNRHIGDFIYLCLSALTFFGGFFAYLRAQKKSIVTGLGFFYFILSNEMIGAVNNSKLELATMGILFWVGALVTKEQRSLLAGGLLGWIINWKFQPLPTALLLLVTLVANKVWKRAALITIGMVAALLFFWALPFAFFPAAFIRSCYSEWARALTFALSSTWYLYASVYTSMSRLVHWPNSAEGVTQLSLIAGAVIGLAVFGWNWKRRPKEEKRVPLSEASLTALAFGGVYSVLFSPMSQSSAYLLATPMLLACFLARNENRSVIPKKLWTTALWFHWIMTSYFYSDLALPSWRAYASTVNFKPWGFVVLTVLYAIHLSQVRKDVVDKATVLS